MFKKKNNTNVCNVLRSLEVPRVCFPGQAIRFWVCANWLSCFWKAAWCGGCMWGTNREEKSIPDQHLSSSSLEAAQDAAKHFENSDLSKCNDTTQCAGLICGTRSSEVTNLKDFRFLFAVILSFCFGETYYFLIFFSFCFFCFFILKPWLFKNNINSLRSFEIMTRHSEIYKNSIWVKEGC